MLRVLSSPLFALALPWLLCTGCGARTPLETGDAGGQGGSGGASGIGGGSSDGGGGEVPAITCEPGAPAVELAQIRWPIAMTHDRDALYVASYVERGGVFRVPKGGGASTLLSAMSYPSGVALAGDEVVVASSGDREVVRVPRAGGSAVRVAGFFGPSDVRVVGSDVFVANYLDDQVARVPLAGGEPLVLSSRESGVYRLATGAGLVVWGSFSETLRGAPLSGGAVVTLAPFEARRIVALDDSFYFTSNGPGGEPRRVVRAGADGSYEVLHEDPDATFVEGISADASHVYYASYSGGADQVLRVPRQGGPPELLVEVDEPLEVLVDGTCLYVTSGSSEQRPGRVLRVGLP